MTKFIYFFKKNTVFCIAVAAAIITSFFIPPDKEYLSYLDMKTLSCLFLTLAVVCALRNIKFFTILARKCVMVFKNLRLCAIGLVYITFIGSMIIANDMALITFLPLGYFALSVTDNEKYMPLLFILQNISANLGGLLTPFGNPQNLYLYSYFEIPTAEFMRIMLPLFILAAALLTLICFFFPKEKLTIKEEFPEKLNIRKTILYLVLFLFSILIVFRIIPYLAGLIIIPAIIYFADKDALKAVDYPLIGTFFFFFIFSGNLSRIPAINSFLSELMAKNTLVFSALSCQFISNVPSAILLSRFTANYRDLLYGVNIGGTGTLIASLASLITFSEFKILYPKRIKEYLFLFFGLNFSFLIIMILFAQFIL